MPKLEISITYLLLHNARALSPSIEVVIETSKRNEIFLKPDHECNYKVKTVLPNNFQTYSWYEKNLVIIFLLFIILFSCYLIQFVPLLDANKKWTYQDIILNYAFVVTQGKDITFVIRSSYWKVQEKWDNAETR